MKKIYSLVGALLITGAAFSQALPTIQGTKLNVNKVVKPAMVIDHSNSGPTVKATTVFTDNFAAGIGSWTVVDNAAGGDVWAYFDGTGGELSSATAADGYAGFDSDGYGNNSIAEDCDLISPSFSCAALTTVSLQFTHFFSDGYGGAGVVSVSADDGATWTAVQNWGAASSNNGDVEMIDVTTPLAGSATCKVKFNWVGDWSWSWFIDDVLVADIPANEVAVNYAAIDVTYPVLPLSQVQPITFTAEVENLGQNAAANLSVDLDLAAGLHTDNTTIMSLAAGATSVETMPNTYTPTLEGFYEGAISLSNVGMDEDLTNNVDSVDFAVSDSTQMSDYGYDNVYNFGDNLEYAQMFEVYTQDTVTSISVPHIFGFAANAHGQTINYAIYSDAAGVPGTEIVATNSYTITPADTAVADLGDITLPIDGGQILAPGTYYAYFQAPAGITGSTVLVADYAQSNGRTQVRDLVGGFGASFFDWSEPAGFGLDFTWSIGVNYGHLPATCTLTATATGTNATTNGGTDGTATAVPSGGQGTLTYSWSPSGGTNAAATGLAAGTYTVTVTDDVLPGCTATASYTVTEPAAPTCTLTASATGTNATTNGGTDGTATATAIGGQGTISYSWSPSGGTNAAATGLAAGTYTVTITDDIVAGCTATASYTVTEPAVPGCTLTATATGTNATTNGGTDGTATAVPSGGQGTISYSWSPSGGTGATATGLAAGTYTVTVTDDVVAGCVATASYTVTEPAAPSCTLTASATGTNATTNGGTDGTATATATGGQGTISYSWSPSGGTSATATGLAAGTYTVTITDDIVAGCTATASYTVTEPAAPSCTLTATATGTDYTAFEAMDGTATAVASGDQGTLTYSWSPSGGSGATATGLSAGTYTVTITDDIVAGCTATASYTVVDGFVSIDETAAKSTFSVYPNPNEGTFNVELSNVNNSSIVVRNVIGQIVFTKAINSTVETVELSDVKSGVYFITAGNITKRFIVK